MANKWSCPFCGSDKPEIDTPYIDKFGEKIVTYCCGAQRRNREYARTRVNPWRPNDEQYDPDRASKF